MIAAPPLSAGAVNVMVAWVLPRDALTPVTADGLPAGVTAADESEAAELAVVFVATTLNLYEVPFVSVENVQEVAGAITVHVSDGDIGFPEESSAVTT
jgi:hypothetical protein